MRWGILGSGLRAHEIAKQIKSNGHELISVASRKKEYALIMAKSVSEKAEVESYESFIRRDDLDAIYVANETSHHFEYLKQALERNHKVFCAKPICFNRYQYENLTQYDGFLVQDIWTDWNPLITKLMAVLKQEKLGKLELIRANFNCIVSPGYNNWRLNSQLSGGGVFWDLMIYLVSITLKLNSSPISQINPNFQMNENDSPLMFDLLINFENLSQAHLTVSSLLNKSQPLLTLCSKGKARIEGSALDPLKLVLEPLNTPDQIIERTPEDPARFSYLSFVRLLSSDFEYKQHRLDTDHLMETMFRIQEMVFPKKSVAIV